MYRSKEVSCSGVEHARLAAPRVSAVDSAAPTLGRFHAHETNLRHSHCRVMAFETPTVGGRTAGRCAQAPWPTPARPCSTTAFICSNRWFGSCPPGGGFADGWSPKDNSSQSPGARHPWPERGSGRSCRVVRSWSPLCRGHLHDGGPCGSHRPSSTCGFGGKGAKTRVAPVAPEVTGAIAAYFTKAFPDCTSSRGALR